MSTTGQALINAIRQAAITEPEKIVSGGSCYYIDLETKCPSCLVGKGLGILDLLPRSESGEIVALERHINNEKFEHVFDLILGDLADDLTQKERLWIQHAQNFQDDQLPWLQCVQIADEEYPFTAEELMNDYRDK